MLSKFSVKKPMTIIVLVLIIAILGVISYSSMSIDLLPEMNLPYIVVATVYPGAPPEVVEKDVTNALENQLSSVPKIKSMTSSSSEHVSMITLEFESDVDVDDAFNNVNAALKLATLPDSDMLQDPIVLKINPTMLPVMQLSISQKGTSIKDSNTYLKQIIQKISAVDGVASVGTGGLIKDLAYVNVSMAKMSRTLAKYFVDVTNIRLELPESEKENIRLRLLSAIQEAKESNSAPAEIQAIKRLRQVLSQDIKNGNLPSDVDASLITSLRDSINSSTAVGYEKMLAYFKSGIDNPGNISMESDFGTDILLTQSEKKYLISMYKNSLEYHKIPLEEKILDGFIYALYDFDSSIEQNNELILQIANEMSKANSPLRKQGIAFVNSILENEYILEEQNKDVFYNTVDQFFAEGVYVVIEGQLSGLSEMLKPSVLQQLLYAQDFDMPAGSIADGAMNFVVKIGENIKTKDDFTNLPIITVDYGKIILTRVEEMKALLSMFGLIAEDGKASFTKLQIDLMAEAIFGYLNPGEGTIPDLGNDFLNGLTEEYRDLLEKLFGDKTADQISADIISMLKFSALFLNGDVNDKADDAIILPEEPYTATSKFVVDFVQLNKNLESVTENAIIPFNLNELSNIYFLDDATKQIASLLIRDSSGNLVSSAAVTLSIMKEPDMSTADVTKSIAALLKGIQGEDSKFEYEILSDDGNIINFMISNIINNLAFGGLIAIGVLLLFLKDIKPTLVVGASIIISLIATFVMMYFSGITLNIVSMGGLSLGVGMLVDNSIVVIENIYRLRAQGKSVYASAIQGAKQVGSAVIASTITTVIVFLPIAFVKGLTKQIFSDMALTISFSLIASLLTALTVVPMAASTFMKKPAKKESKVMIGMKNTYIKALNFSLKHKFIPLILVTVLFGGSIFSLFQMKTELIPNMDMGSVAINCSIDRMAVVEKEKQLGKKYSYEDAINETVDILSSAAQNYNDIKSMGITFTSGVNIGGMEVGGGDVSAIITMIDEKKRTMSTSELSEDIVSLINSRSNGLFKLTTSSNSVMDFVAFGGGSYNIRINGDDVDLMRQQSDILKNILSKVDGVMNAEDDLGKADQEYKVVIDKAKANRYGLTVAEIFLQMQEALTIPGIAHTLRLSDLDAFDSTGKKDCDVYIYSYDYKAESWLRGYEKSTDSDKNFTPIYKNADGHYLINKGKSLYTEEAVAYKVLEDDGSGNMVEVTKTENRAVFVPEGGKINLTQNGNDFTYKHFVPVTESVGDKNITTLKPTGLKTISARNNLTYYEVSRIEDIDLVLFQIATKDNFNPTAPSEFIPLYKMLSDDSFIKGADGNVLFRENLNPDIFDNVPSAIATQPGFLSISHNDRRKTITITANFNEDADADTVIANILKAIKDDYDPIRPQTIFIDTSTGNELLTETFNTLYLVLALAIVLIYLVMMAQFQSLKSPLIIMITIPLAFTGAIFALLLFSPTISIMAMIGLIILMGIVVNNGIVYVDYVNKLIEQGVPKRMAILRTGLDRMRPILMTALTTICALIIMAFDSSGGGQMLQPMAIATIGGLLYSTFLTLFFVPIIYDMFNRKAKQSDRSKAFMSDDEIDKIDKDNIFDHLDRETEEFLATYVPNSEKTDLFTAVKEIESKNQPKVNDKSNTAVDRLNQIYKQYNLTAFDKYKKHNKK